jgi:hypothetical protein
MRNLPQAAAISAVVHAAMVVWLAMRPPAPRHAADAPAATPIEIVTADRATPPAEAIDVVIMDEPAIDPTGEDPRPAGNAVGAPTPHDTASPSASPSARAAPRVEAPTSSPAPARTVPPSGQAVTSVPPRAPTAGETAPRAPGRNPLLAMRRGEVPRAALPSGRWDDLDHAPRGTAPARDRTTGQLDDAGGGSHRSDQGVFEARIAPDGTARLTDQPNLRVHVAVPMPRDLGRSLARWYESDKGRFGTDGDTAMAAQIQGSACSKAEPPDPVTGKLPEEAPTVVVPVIAGGFDITDGLMRSHGQDPYARRKLAFLDATRDERAEIGRQHRDAELARSSELVQKSLQAAWAATPDLSTRKQALFELWDDCAETGDPAVIAAGEAARRLVIGFIRGHLPAGSPDAFTAAEIAALGRTQQSKAVFRPYE